MLRGIPGISSTSGERDFARKRYVGNRAMRRNYEGDVAWTCRPGFGQRFCTHTIRAQHKIQFVPEAGCAGGIQKHGKCRSVSWHYVEGYLCHPFVGTPTEHMESQMEQSEVHGV